jgi:phosphoribosylaminoimidazolecarboxamide formyltransferase/IMP cyclohydrolase
MGTTKMQGTGTPGSATPAPQPDATLGSTVSTLRRALLSVTDKSGLVELGRALVARGVELVASGGTAAALRDAALAITRVEDVTRSPEMLDGRVKTLHPALHAGILADRGKPQHLADLEAHGMTGIDLVVVNYYDFAAASGRETLPIEAIDIGGPTLGRAAAKNHAWVTVLSDPSEYAPFLAALDAGRLDLEWRRGAAARTFARVAEYDRAIATRFASATAGDAALASTDEGSTVIAARAPAPSTAPRPAAASIKATTAHASEVAPARTWPEVWVRHRVRVPLLLRYGENPHQAAAVYRDEPAWGLGRMRQLGGSELSFNNLLDAEAALALVRDLGEAPAAVLVKHNNPCGAARGANAAAAFRAALGCDPVSAFGGIAAFNVPLDADAAAAIGDLFLEVLCAPEITDEALSVLASKKRLRILEVPPDAHAHLDERLLHGLLLVQEPDSGWPEMRDLEVVTRRAPDDAQRRDAEFLLRVCKHVRSNAIVVGRGERTLGIGAGQMSRVDSCELAVRKATSAGHDLTASVAASDAFFPFADGIEKLAAAGVETIVQPGGSKRDPEVIEAADRLGMSMLVTHRRHFRH